MEEMHTDNASALKNSRFFESPPPCPASEVLLPLLFPPSRQLFGLLPDVSARPLLLHGTPQVAQVLPCWNEENERYSRNMQRQRGSQIFRIDFVEQRETGQR